MTIRHRVHAFLKARRRPQMVELPPRQADYNLTDSVAAASRSARDTWRLVGRDESPLGGLVSPGEEMTSLILLGAAGDVPAASPGTGEVI
jgi:hypothetical protein